MDALLVLWAALAPFLFVLLGLISIQFLLGVAVAIFVNHNFEVKKLPDVLAFYAPRMLGWLALELAVLIPPEVLAYIPTGEYTAMLMAGAGKIAFGLIALTALGGILGHLQAIGLMPAGFLPTLNRVGVPSTSLTKPSGDGTPRGG